MPKSRIKNLRGNILERNDWKNEDESDIHKKSDKENNCEKKYKDN